MARRADIGLNRFISWSVMWAASSKNSSLDERVEYGVYRTLVESEHGGTGIGRSTARTANRRLGEVLDEVRRRLAQALIAEGA